MDTFISIIMPVYNVEKYLTKAVQSVLNQTYSNFELIIIDDGSTDNSRQIIEKMSKQDKRINILFKENTGVSDSRNKGIEIARGEYIYFIDSDDYLEPSLLFDIVVHAEQKKADIVMFGHIVDYLDNKENIKRKKSIKLVDGVYDKSSFNKIQINSEILSSLGFVWNKLYSLKYLRNKRHTFPVDVSYEEDMIFNSQVLAHCNKLVMVSETYYHYVQRPKTTLSNTYKDDLIKLKLRAIDSRRELFMKWDYEPNYILNVISELYFVSIKSCINLICDDEKFGTRIKRKKIQGLLNNNIVREALYNSKTIELKDKIIKILAILKFYSLIIFIYSISSTFKQKK